MSKQELPNEFDRLPIKLTDMELQYVADQLRRAEQMKREIDRATGESIQHFTVICAKKRNMQWDDERFAGVAFDTENQRPYILLKKD